MTEAANRPIFMPLWNYASNQGGPDPDYVYSTTEVDTAGVEPGLHAGNLACGQLGAEADQQSAADDRGHLQEVAALDARRPRLVAHEIEFPRV